MRTKFLLVPIIFFSSLTLWAADNFTRLNLKEGLWEMTTTHTVTGAPPISAEALAKMTPEQRTHFEAMMKEHFSGAPQIDVHKNCLTKEMLDKKTVFDQNQKECTRTVVTSTSSALEVKIRCQGQGKDHNMSSDGTFLLQTSGAESAKGSMHSVTNGGGHTMNMDMTFTTKYLGPACGDVK